MPATEVTMGILQAAIIAVPFWFTSIQYWLQHSYQKGDARYRWTSALLGIGASMGLLALLLAIRYSTDAVLSEVGSDITTAIRLIDLFTIIAFGLLSSIMGDKMAEEENENLAFKYSMTFIFIAPLAIAAIIFGYVLLLLGAIIIVLLVTSVYGLFIRPKINKYTREETDHIYPDLMVAIIDQMDQLGGGREPLSSDREKQLRDLCAQFNMTEEDTELVINKLKERRE